jgi:hypothetical protein
MLEKLYGQQMARRDRFVHGPFSSLLVWGSSYLQESSLPPKDSHYRAKGEEMILDEVRGWVWEIPVQGRWLLCYQFYETRRELLRGEKPCMDARPVKVKMVRR